MIIYDDRYKGESETDSRIESGKIRDQLREFNLISHNNNPTL